MSVVVMTIESDTLFDSHDSVERVLLLLLRLVVSNQRKKIVPMAGNKASTQRNDPGWIPVADPTTGLASVTMSTIRLRRHPTPTPIPVHCSAHRAHRRFGKFGGTLIGVVNMLVYQSVLSCRRSAIGSLRHCR